MKKMLILTAAVALLAPVAALANASTTNASRDCAALKAKMGATDFGKAYANFGACVSAMTPLERTNATSAQQLCTTEQNDANFAASHSGKTFAQFYGTGKKGKNAFGQCVSLKASASSQVVRQSQTNPARSCASVRSQPKNAFGKCVSKAAHAQVNAQVSAAKLCLTEQSLSGFEAHWGTNANLSNAFGMCVSSTAHSIQSKS